MQPQSSNMENDKLTLSHVNNQIIRDSKVGKIRKSFARLEAVARDFTLVNHHGEFVTLYDTLEKEPVVINFYQPANNISPNDGEVFNLNKTLLEHNVRHYVISQDQAFLSRLSKYNSLSNIDLLHDQHLSTFYKYGLVSNEIDTPFELFEQKRKSSYNFNQYANATYLIGINRRIQFSQINFSDEFIHAQSLIEELTIFDSRNNIEMRHEQH